MVRPRILLPPRRLALAMVLLVSGASLASGDSPVKAAGDPVLTAVGDVNTCRNPESDTATAALAAAVDGPIALLGDWVEGRAPGEIQTCVESDGWGALKGRIRPTPGDNGEYGRNPALQRPGTDLLTPYFNYFGTAAGKPQQPWYSYDIGTWHVVVLDTNCSDEEAKCPAESAQMEWLRADLAAANARCLAVTTHHNIIEQDKTFATMRVFLQPLYDAGLDLWLSGHRHTYRRYGKVDILGAAHPDGFRHFVAGTGGHPRNPGQVSAGGVLEKSNGGSWGVLRFTLKRGAYDWDFVPVRGVKGSTPFTDSGSDTCSTKPGQVDMTGPSTSQPPATAPSATPPSAPSDSPQIASGRSGYWMVGADGAVYGFGQADHHGGVTPTAGTAMVDLESTPSGNGYWTVDSRGRAVGHGDAVNYGSPDSFTLDDERVTSLSATSSGKGYWMFTDRGRVLVFGDARHLGDMSTVKLNGPVLDSVPSPSGQGYYMVASDGGIFAFGDAVFHGSMGGHPLNAPVRSLVPDGDGVGYWLVAADGGIFAFEAPFRGAMGGTELNRPVTGMVRFGNGYLMVGEDGGIFNFSDRPFHGSLGDRPPPGPIVAVATVDR